MVKNLPADAGLHLTPDLERPCMPRGRCAWAPQPVLHTGEATAVSPHSTAREGGVQRQRPSRAKNKQAFLKWCLKINSVFKIQFCF